MSGISLRTVLTSIGLSIAFSLYYWADLYPWYTWLDLEFPSQKPDIMSKHEEWKGASSVYDFEYVDIDGNKQSMDRYRGHVLIVANVASKCGLTKANYEQFGQLYDKYADSQGLRILGFPSNQFLSQEPGTESEIKDFVCTNYKVKFDFASKIDVNGDNAHPLWKYMKSKQGGTFGSFAKWNFTKFLVDKEGNVVKRYSPDTEPKQIEKDLLKYFAE